MMMIMIQRRMLKNSSWLMGLSPWGPQIEAESL